MTSCRIPQKKSRAFRSSIGAAGECVLFDDFMLSTLLWLIAYVFLSRIRLRTDQNYKKKHEIDDKHDALPFTAIGSRHDNPGRQYEARIQILSFLSWF